MPRSFRLWILAAAAKWVVLLTAIPFIACPPPAWVSVCFIVFMFGHFASEYCFPGGYRALEEICRRPFHRRLARFLFMPGEFGLLLTLGHWLVRHSEWLTRSELRVGATLGIGLIFAWWLAYVAHRDFLMARFWPKLAHSE
jgi:hypothetical protein